jgi:hypothetical protein
MACLQFYFFVAGPHYEFHCFLTFQRLFSKAYCGGLDEVVSHACRTRIETMPRFLLTRGGEISLCHGQGTIRLGRDWLGKPSPKYPS